MSKSFNHKVVSDVIDIVVEKTGVEYAELVGQSRKRGMVNARQCAIWLIKKHAPSITLQELGKVFGNRHHATIIHAIDAVDDQIYCKNKEFTWVRKVLPNGANDIVLHSDAVIDELSKAARALKLGYIVESHARIERAIEIRAEQVSWGS